MTLEQFVAAAMLVSLVVYALTGGADYGGGFWALLARGPRAAAQREAVQHAIAPVWEANHVWLIFVVVIMFTAFPIAFARMGIELVAPITVLLIGIVMRGSAFVFRSYGGLRRWATVFQISSVVTPVFLGIVLGAITAGPPWWGAFPLAVGALALAIFAFLAAIYLTVEATDPALQRDFRRRFYVGAVAVVLAAGIAALLARTHATRFAENLFESGWSAPVIGITAMTLIASLAFAIRRHDHAARAAAIVTVILLVIGWGAAHAPLLVAPDLTIQRAASPRATLLALVPVLVVGVLLLVPSLAWLLRVFKARKPA